MSFVCLSFGLSQHFAVTDFGRRFHEACDRWVMGMQVDILLIEIDLRVVDMNILLIMVKVHLIHMMSRRPTLPRGLRNETTMCETIMGRHWCIPKRHELASFTKAP